MKVDIRENKDKSSSVVMTINFKMTGHGILYQYSAKILGLPMKLTLSYGKNINLWGAEG